QLLAAAPDPEARLYYATMVQDESRHTEAWVRLIGQVGGEGERDPYLDELAHMFLEVDLLEEKVFLMQVFFERLIIPRFRLIARSSRGTILEDLCNRLAVDDGIHHGAGMAYERVLLEGADANVKNMLIEAANRMLPEFAAHALWRPKAREMIGQLMESRDEELKRRRTVDQKCARCVVVSLPNVAARPLGPGAVHGEQLDGPVDAGRADRIDPNGSGAVACGIGGCTEQLEAGQVEIVADLAD